MLLPLLLTTKFTSALQSNMFVPLLC